MEQYTIYFHVPRSAPFFPFAYIAKRWLSVKESPVPFIDEKFHFVTPDIELLREHFYQRGLVKLNRSPDDHHSIVEIWI